MKRKNYFSYILVVAAIILLNISSKVYSQNTDKLYEKIEDEVPKNISFPDITISDDIKKSASCASVEAVAFKDQKTVPFFVFIFNKSPDEKSAIKFSLSVIARDRKFCDFIKDPMERISHILEPSSVSKHKSLLS